jgi:membrane-bound serine protease (ClpP class)
MKRWLMILLGLFQLLAFGTPGSAADSRKVYVLPIRDEIEPWLVYIVRRGVKEAMDAKADTLVLDMDTNGGRLDSTEKIIEILGQFKGTTVTYVNKKAFSAGAFISFATQKIYMSPQSVIGAAAPIVLSPTGDGVEKLPETYEAKVSSAASALVRASAEKNGHNVEVADAMVKKDKELKIDDKILNEKGQLLTLTDREAAAKYGNPPKPLLSEGTVDSLDDLLRKLGSSIAEAKRIEPTGAEKVAGWINAIAPLLLIIGAIGAYVEFKTPGFGIPGITAVVAFGLYFFGGYIAGLSGALWVFVFLFGIILVLSEFFVHPGTIAPGLIGAALMFVAVIMAMVDIYPGSPALPTSPIALNSLQQSFKNIVIATIGTVLAVAMLARFLPKTSMYQRMISVSVSGLKTEKETVKRRVSRNGQLGVSISMLRPGGKAQFGDEILDVISQGDLIPKGQKVKIIGHSGTEAIVEAVA